MDIFSDMVRQEEKIGRRMNIYAQKTGLKSMKSIRRSSAENSIPIHSESSLQKSLKIIPAINNIT